jgi:hypothetical protein
MGTYNPYAPHIVGEEWVPIRDETLTFAPDVNTYEQGYGFNLPTATQVGDARFYINDYPPGGTTGQAFLTGIYPRGQSANSGPVRSVIIPCNSAGVTGTGTSGSASSVKSPADNAYMLLPGDVQTTAGFFFAVDNYPFLNGKRILGVNFLYLLNMNTGAAVSINDVPKVLSLFTPVTLIAELGTLNGAQTNPAPVESFPLGEATTVPLATFTPTSNDRLPWRYQDLQRLQANSSSRIQVTITNSTFGTGSLDTLRIGYAALEVFYCDERRVAIGGWGFGETTFASDWQLGMNKMPIRDISTYAVSPVLPAGDYEVTLSSPNPQSFYSTTRLSTGYTAPVNALRELFTIPTHPGVKVIIPQSTGEFFTASPTSILPQISLHASGSGAVLAFPHVYGRQVAAPVYGSITATTETDPTPGEIASYPQLRYYARRFGDTRFPLKLSSASYPSSSVSITPPEFDELEEIIDGWKEVTLRFTTPPTFIPSGAVIPWVWSSTGETVGNRWEVLGARAPAVSGITGNFTQEVPSGQRLGPATYYSANGNGATTALTWQAPPASGVAEDPSSDGVLVFVQDPPTVTGFGVSMLTQELTGIGELCEQTNSCSITGLYYHKLSWTASSGDVVGDTFVRSVASNGWGTSTSGAIWSVGAGASSVWSTTGSAGYVNPSAASTSYMNLTNLSKLNVEAEAIISIDAIPSSESSFYFVSRYADSSNWYAARLIFSTDGTTSLGIEKTVAGVTTQLVSSTLTGFAYVAGTQIHVKTATRGSVILVKAWIEGEDEPEAWNVVTTDTSLTAAGLVGVRAYVGDATINFTVNDYQASWAFGAFELQRKDTLDTTWQTIMLATSPLVTSFNDYEARVGVLSTYRIRVRDVYDFAGSWSTERSNTLTAPGVTTATFSSPKGVLMLTTNEYQDGTGNLAYVETWEKPPQTEDFVFPESDMVTYQRMYDKDYFTAFHPAERGGVRFSRTLLIQNAAVTTRVLDNVAQAIRDLAWNDVSYVCVRTEDGDRWLASVVVPDVAVKRARRLHMVRIEVTEVTETFTPVDPV